MEKVKNSRLGWNVEFLPQEASGDILDLAISLDGYIFVACPSALDSSLLCFHRHMRQETWIKEVVDPEPLSALFLDITLLSSKIPAITYMNLEGIDLILAIRRGETWEKIALEVPGDVGGFPKAKPLAENFLVITFYDYSSSQLKLGIYKDGHWSSIPIMGITPPGKIDLEVVKGKVFIAVKAGKEIKLVKIDLNSKKMFTVAPEWFSDSLNFDFTPIGKDNSLVFANLTSRGNLHLGIVDLENMKVYEPKQLIFPRPMKFRGDISIKTFRDEVFMSFFEADNADLYSLKLPITRLFTPEKEVRLTFQEVFLVDSIGDVGERNKLEIAKVTSTVKLEPEDEDGAPEVRRETYYYAFIVYTDKTNNRVKLARFPLHSEVDIQQE